jgi:O-antigen/teichoic acid export membrane protein
MGAFGSDFAGGGPALQFLSIGQFVNVATGSVGVLLVMSGHEKAYRNIQIVAACIVVGLSYALIPTYGAAGAAIGAAAALIVQNVLFGYSVWAKLGILLLIPKSLVHRKSGGT